MADPRWMCASGVLGRLHPYDPERFGEVEEALSRGWDAERRLEAYTRDYGMWHWGDGHTAWDMKRKRWADVYRCWRSFHHGAPRTSWVLYLRSGDPKYWRHALRNARHCMDVDVCHWATDEDEKLPWPKGKICGALRDYKGITHWHAGGRLFDYNCLTDFMLYYYYMTGDHRGMEVAQEWGDAAKRLFTSPFGSRSGAGVLSSLIDLYQATWDPALKRLIDAQIEHFFKVQVTDDNQIAPDGVASAVPKFRGKPLPRGAFTEWENYAPWIERHYDLTADRRTGDRIALWADSYLAGWGDSWSGMGVGAYVNVLAYAYFASKDVKYLEHGLYCVQKYANSVERSPGQFYDGFPHQGQMSLGPGYMEQRIPHLLAALAEHGKPVEAQSLATGPFSLLFTRRWPEGKKVEYVDAIIREEHDAAFSVVALGGTTYKDKPIRMVFKSPSGKELVNKAHAVQPGAFELKADAPADGETGDYQVQVSGEGSFWNVQSTLRTEPALKIVYPFDGRQVRLNASRYYFLVPKGVTVFRVAATPIGAGAIYAVRDPEGRQVKRVTVPMGEDAAKAVITAEVRPEQAGRLWQIEGLSADVVLRIEAEGGEVPPFFAVDPEAFFVPAPAKAK
jgi:hypothetical protein